jgi:hypothetical protein
MGYTYDQLSGDEDDETIRGRRGLRVISVDFMFNFREREGLQSKLEQEHLER